MSSAQRRSLAIFLLALGVRLIALWASRHNPSFLAPIYDANDYDALARELALGQGASSRLFWQPILYPVLLGALYALSDGSIVLAKGVQAAIGAGTCSVVYRIGRDRLGERGGLIAAGITLLYGPLILFEGELLATGLATFLTVALIFVAFRLLERIEAGHGVVPVALALGLLGAGAILTRPTFVPYVVLVALWLALRVVRLRGLPPAIALLSALALGLVALLGPAALWSERATGELVVLPSSGGINLHLGNNPDVCTTLRTRGGRPWLALLAEAEAEGHHGERAQNAYFLARTLQFAREQPRAYVAGLGRKALEMIGSRELPRNLDVYQWRRWSAFHAFTTWKIGPFGFPWGVVFPLALVGFVLRPRALGAPVLLFALLHSAAIIAVFVSARYRIPLVPVLALAAAAGWLELTRRLAEGSRRAQLHGLALLAAGVLLCTVPGPFCEEQQDFERDFFYGVGFAHERRGRDVLAAMAYRAGLSAVPGDPELHYNLAGVLRRSGEIERAIANYERALVADPDFAMAHNNLGVALEAASRGPEALAHYRRAFALDPGLTVAADNVVKLALALGQPEQALATLDALIGENERITPLRRAWRGAARLETGDSSGAVLDLRAALAGGMVDAATRLRLGMALVRQGDGQGALAEFEAVLRREPGRAEAHYGAGLALLALDRRPEARSRFERALELEPGHPGAADQLRRMR